MLCPEHVALLHNGGFSRKELCTYLYHHARIPLAAFGQENVDGMLRRRRPWLFAQQGDDLLVPIADRPEQFHMVVAGGAGPHSVFMPSFGMATRAVTVPIAFPSRRK